MNISLPLSPHLEQFVREQLASGLFQTESDVILAALRLLESKSLTHNPLSSRLKQDFGQGMIGNPSEPLHADRGFHNEAERIPSERRSPRGILADVCSYISPEDIKEARREMWSGLSHGEP